MGSVAELVIDVLVNTEGAQEKAEGLAKEFEGVGGRLTKALSGVAIGAGLVGFAQAAFSAASDLEQAVGGVNAIFAENADQVHAWASDTTDSIRLPQAEWENYATILGALLKNAGTPMDQLAGKTKGLIQLGADLAARYGTTTARAVETLTSALKGNFAMLDEYGINVTAAAIKTESLKIAHGDATKAATDAVKTQATLNLVMRQSVDAQGAAASESETFASAQEKLNEKWTNFLAAVGGPALTSAGLFLGLLSDAITFIEPVIIGITTLVAGFGKLPAPIQVAATALFAMIVLRGPLTAMFTGLVSGLQTAYLHALYAKDAFRQAGGGLAGFGAVARGALGSIKSLGASMLAAFGGGIGLAITAAVVALTFGLTKIAEGNQRVKQMAEEAASAVDAVADAIRDIDPSKLTEVGGAAALAQLKTRSWGRESKDLTDFNVRLGIGLDDVLKAMTGVPGAADKVTAAYTAQKAKLEDIIKTNSIYTDAGMQSTPVADRAQEDLTILTEMYDAYTPLVDITGQAAEQNRIEAEALRNLGGAADDSTAAVLDAKTAQEALKTALEGAKEAAQSTGGAFLVDTIAVRMQEAARAADIFNAAMDRVNGRSRDYQANTLSWADGIRGLAESFKAASEKGELNVQALKEWDIGALASTKTGSALAGSLLDQSEGFGKFVTQAFEASGGVDNMNVALGAAHVAADQAYKDFIDMATGAGLSAESADQLATKLGIVDAQHIDDKIFEIIAQDQEAAMKAKLWESVTFDDKTLKFVTKIPAAQELADQMNAKYGGVTPAPVSVPTTIQPPTNAPPGAFGQVIMGAQAQATSGTIVVPTQIQPPTTAAGAPGLFGSLFINGGGGAATTAPVQVPTTVQAPTSVPAGPVGEAVQGQAPTTQPISVSVQADTTAAQGAITALVTQTRILKIIVDANLSIAQGVVAAFVGASYSLTVAFLANPSVAISVINAFTRARYEATVQILGDNNDAIRAVRAVTTGSYSATVRILGDNLDAISAVRAITTGYYTATIHIQADTTAFYAAFNALPSSRSVTVNQVPGTTVAPPAPSGFLAPTLMGARGLAPMALTGGGPVSYGSGGSGGGDINITIEGAIDPDRTARQIESLLRGRSRRTGSVNIGG